MRRLTAAWYLAGGLLTAGQVALPLGPLHDAAYLATAVGALVLGVVGARRYRNPPRGPWLLLVAGTALWVVGDVVWAVVGDIGGGQTFPPGADVFYLAGYATFVAGLWGFARGRTRGSNANAVVDALLVGTVVGLAFFVGFVAPAWERSGEPTADVVLALAYLLFDVVLLVQVAHLARVGTGARAALRLVGVAFGALLVGDVLRNVAAQVDALAASPHVVDTWWMVCYLALGGAALHPSRAEAGAPAGGRPLAQLTVPQIAALGGVLLLLPAVPVVEVLAGRTPHIVAPVTASGIVIVLVCVRLGLVARRMREQADELVRLARTDGLTGLANAATFAAALEARLGACPATGPAGSGGRTAAGEGVVVVLVALDRVTEITDSLGFRVGDELLRRAAERLGAAAGGHGLAARLGGEAFAVVADARDVGDPVVWGQRIRADLVAPFRLSDVEVSVDALVGVVVGPDDGAEVEELLQRADVALSAARSRADHVARYTGRMAAAGVLTPHLMTELPAALAHGQLVLHHQPQVDLALGRVSGVEALVRWQHPVHGLLPPAAFVPAAERTGLIRRLTLHVLELALDRSAAWRADGRALTVAVNLSARDLLDPGIVGSVERVLERRGLAAESLELEVTESMAMVDPRRSLAVLQALAALGVVLTVDDFGTGYSSLSYLQRLPVRRLKIDRSFTRGVVDDGPSAAIVRSTIELARNLGMTVVAEGVEDDVTLVALREMGCDAAQGFGIGRPVPADRVPGLVDVIEERVPRVLRDGLAVGGRVV